MEQDTDSSDTKSSENEQTSVHGEDLDSGTDKKLPVNVTPKGNFVTTHHGLPNKPKCVRNFKCKVCDEIFGSTREWNCRYEASHPLLSCSDCDKTFWNPTSLYRHRYTHTKTENVYPFPQCAAVFPFHSQLKSHMFKHRKISHFPCSYHGCKKAFKTDWNRCAHERSHQNKETKCNHCDYTTTNLRYLKQHECVHSDTPTYTCKNCNKGFRFYEQKKGHDKKGCT